ncbi:MAG: tetratricopeptide repeat protein [bacterium]
MQRLTQKQKASIKKNYSATSAAEFARRFKVDEQVVAKYIQSLSPQLSKSKQRLFKLIMVLLPLVFLLLLELGLRAFHYGPNLDIFVTFENDPRYLITNLNVGKRYFFIKQVLPATSYDAFLKHKPENGYRIFVLGGSSAAGYPYLHNGAFSRMLKTRLEDFFPERYFEVINLAMPAVNSYTLLDFADELVAYQPDAFLIYAGHNEFYGALGVGSTEALGQFRSVVNLYLKLQHFKTFYLLRSFIGWLKTHLPAGQGPPLHKDATLMERMVGRSQIEFGSTEYKKARAIFKANLKKIFEIAQKHHIETVVSDLVSNMHDQPPFESIYKEGPQRLQWDKLFQAGKKKQAQGQWSQALAFYQQAVELDDGVAILHYEMARCLEAAGELEQAKKRYYRAKDLDALRFRASEDFNDAIHEIAAAMNVPVIPMKALFESHSPNGFIGRNLMLDHLHPNLEGFFGMAKAFSRMMEENGFIAASWDSSKARSDAEYWQNIDVTPLDQEVANLKIQLLLAGWPFQEKFEPDKILNKAPENKVQEIALSIIQDKKAWDVAHVELAEFYTRNGDLEKAAQEYKALVKGTPYNVSPYLRLGLNYLEQRKYPEALTIFQRSLKIEESSIAYKWIGSIYVNKRKPATGIPYLQKALEINRRDPEAIYNLSVAFAMHGDFEQAKSYCQELLQSNPDHPGVKKLWAKLNSN